MPIPLLFWGQYRGPRGRRCIMHLIENLRTRAGRNSLVHLLKKNDVRQSVSVFMSSWERRSTMSDRVHAHLEESYLSTQTHGSSCSTLDTNGNGCRYKYNNKSKILDPN